ncbi:MAG: 1,4-alpha-glucan branching protein domain-containing protein [Clostridia bacterium]|nr:1,4-alpha-glucan branching protein domain-containing protein [Clostridia bacterium]
MSKDRAKFIMVLHSHLPWVMGCGKWPFGEEWIYEIAWDCYLPLIRSIRNLARDGVPSNLTVSITPVLAQQLATDGFKQGFASYLEDRRLRVKEDRAEFLQSGRTDLAKLAFWMEDQLSQAMQEYDGMRRDLPGAFAALARDGMIELATSAATHAYLPLLKCDKSRKLQIRMGKVMFTDVMGIEPKGFWFPECAYKPGLESFVDSEGYRYTVLDAMAVKGGKAVSHYGQSTRVTPDTGKPVDTVYLCGSSDLMVFPRHPQLCAQVWSKWTGYPGDFTYREFHRQNPRSGMRYHRVTDSVGDLSTKKPYDPEAAVARAKEHAAHFVAQVEAAADRAESETPVLTTAFDTELYGHWWFEGPIFLEEVSRLFAKASAVDFTTPSRVVDAVDHARIARVEPVESSWGVNCDHSVWMNENTRPMWEKIWEVEDVVDQSWVLTPFGPWPGDFWNLQGDVDRVLREFLLMMASDWEFLMYTDTAGDYPQRRFEGHRRSFAEAYSRLREELHDHNLSEYSY